MKLCSLVLSLAEIITGGQQQKPGIDITLEHLQSDGWRKVNSATIFGVGDFIRFRIKTAADSYLYVVNDGTSGERVLLFPTEKPGGEERVLAGREYLIPATGGRFRVTGPAGYDRIHWVLSPVQLGTGVSPAVGQSQNSGSGLSPRCDDSIFRARGVCTDSAAGLKRVRTEPDLAVYEFRLAHR